MKLLNTRNNTCLKKTCVRFMEQSVLCSTDVPLVRTLCKYIRTDISSKGKGKGKVHSCTGTEAFVQVVRPIGGVEGVALLFHDQWHWKGVRGQRHVPAALYPLGKTRYPLHRKMDGPPGRSGQVRKISPPRGFDPRTIQPVASCYFD